MTVLKRETEPQGTYTEGYDAGLRDATTDKPRAIRRPTSRMRNAGFYRNGYADGYDDGTVRTAEDHATVPHGSRNVTDAR